MQSHLHLQNIPGIILPDMVNDKKLPCQDSLSTITPIVYFWGTTMVLGLSLTSGQMAFVTSQVNLTVFAKK